jgi:Ca2+-binding RTX toxin-like protein
VRERASVLAAAFACALALGGAPATAGAVDVSLDAAGTLHVVDADGVEDRLFVWRPIPEKVEVRSAEFGQYYGAPAGTPVTAAGDGCATVDVGVVRCDVPATMDFDLGAGNDLLHVGRQDLVPPATVRDGGGNDLIVIDVLSTLTFIDGPGNDVLDSFAQQTHVVAGPGADDYTVGQVADQVLDYSAYTVGVSVTPDETANDGAPGEGDNVHQQVGRAFYRIIGGSGDDHLQSARMTQVLEGRAGNDTIFAAEGSRAEGGAGNS